MTSSKDAQIVEKLNSNNYNVWKFKLEMLLIKEDLFEIITDEPPNPITTDWSKKDRKARAIINLSIEDSQIVHVKNIQNARDTWNTLKTIHERSNLSSKLYLLRKLYSTKLPEGGDMNKHITNILELIDKLSAIGETIRDNHISALLLCSLPASYDTLITALESRNEDELTPTFIKSKLIDEYNRRSNSSESSENTARAFKTTKKFNNAGYKFNNAGYKKEQKYCSNCKLNNHSTKECWHNNNYKSKQYNPSQNSNYKQNYKKNFNSSLVFQKDDKTVRNDYVSNSDKNADCKEYESNQGNKHCAFIIKPRNNKAWIVDSGSSSHITNDQHLFTEIKSNEKTNVVIANGNKLTSYGSGNTEIKTITSDGETHNITLKDVLFVPDIESNLFSVSKATENGCEILFENDKCKLTHNGITRLEAVKKNNLYEIQLANENANVNYVNKTYSCKNNNCIELWHKRFGHKNFASIKQIEEKHLAKGIQINKCKHDTTCETCIKTKLTDAPYPKLADYRATKRLALIHSDVCGPFQIPTIGGKTYFLTFVDDYSRFTILYLLSKKSEVYEKLKEFVALVSNKFGEKPKNIRTDNGGEFNNDLVDNYLRKNGIKHQHTVPYSPSQNGVAERKNRTLIEMTRALLSEANLPQKFWGEAICTANHLQNRLPTKANEKSPYELWNGRPPNLHYLRVFGCKAFAYVNKNKRHKLDDKAVEGIFVGYDNYSKGYRIYTSGKEIIIARTVKFLENKNIHEKVETQLNLNENTYEENYKPQNKNFVEIEVTNTEDTPSETRQLTPEPRRSDRSNKGVPPDRFIYLTTHEHIKEPENFHDIMNIENPEEKQQWLNATKEEINSLNKNKTWTLVDPPQGKKIIGSRWIFKTKYDDQGRIQKYKARLVAKGYYQKYGVDYEETFAPVVSYTTLRSFIAAAAYHKLKIHHVDIKTAFLYGDLDEEIYITQPEGYIIPNQENKVCRLNKSIYGLKQAARSWHTKITKSLNDLKFKQSNSDTCLYIRNEGESKTYIIVYVDDILIAGKDDEIKEIIETLKGEYELKDLGEISYYLGIKIEKTAEGYELNQRAKIEELVKKFNLEEAKPVGTPMEPNFNRLEDNDNLLPNNVKYRQAIGSLLYIASVSRPDISAAVNILSRRNESPRNKDWMAAKRVMRYLNCTKKLNLRIDNKSEPILKAFADADWAGDTSSRKSTSGNLFTLGNNAIHWITKKQSCIALSTAEAEYVSAAGAGQEIIYLLKLLEDLDLPQTKPITLYEDNQSCIKMIESEKFSKRSKHIDIRFHAIKQLKEDGIIELKYCPSKYMIADALTKPTPKSELVNHKNSMNLFASSI